MVSDLPFRLFAVYAEYPINPQSFSRLTSFISFSAPSLPLPQIIFMLPWRVS